MQAPRLKAEANDSTKTDLGISERWIPCQSSAQGELPRPMGPTMVELFLRPPPSGLGCTNSEIRGNERHALLKVGVGDIDGKKVIK